MKKRIIFNIPSWVRYMAQDKDGAWYFYAEKPTTSIDSWCSPSKFSLYRIDQPNKSWEDSLTEVRSEHWLDETINLGQ